MLFEILQHDDLIDEFYQLSKEIFFKAASKYSINTYKFKNGLFKSRNFDKEYIRPEILNYYADQQVE